MAGRRNAGCGRTPVPPPAVDGRRAARPSARPEGPGVRTGTPVGWDRGGDRRPWPQVLVGRGAHREAGARRPVPCAPDRTAATRTTRWRGLGRREQGRRRRARALRSCWWRDRGRPAPRGEPIGRRADPARAGGARRDFPGACRLGRPFRAPSSRRSGDRGARVIGRPDIGGCAPARTGVEPRAAEGDVFDARAVGRFAVRP